MSRHGILVARAIFPETLANPWLLGGVMLFWIVAPLAAAYARFRH